MPKNIVICCDGTGNEYSKNNTNVIGTFSAIIRDEKQHAFYDTGVGTFNPMGLSLGPISKRIGITSGQAFGYGIKQNVQEAYEYLMNRYETGDKLYVFGFSRGAYTARLLVGMLNRVGVLQKGSKNLIPSVMKMNFEEEDLETVKGFKNAFCHECSPHFVGVWDTVASIGYFHPARHFKDDVLNHDVKFAYHAISIDEQRKKFPVSLWDESKKADHQTIEQVWFSGVHSDIGGWYTERGLSDLAFQWMMEKALNCGLRLKETWRSGLECDAKGTIHNSRSGFWKVWSAVEREIPDGALIHESVFSRMEELGYKPPLPSKYKKIS